MLSRRKFLQTTGTLALGNVLLPKSRESFSLADYRDDVGLQLYTLGPLMVKDTENTLRQLAAIGFKELESAGSEKGNFYGYTPKEFAALVKRYGMNWRSAHVGGAPFSPRQMMRMAKTAQDSARINGFVERMKNMPPALNLTDNYQQLANDAAEAGLTYLICASIPVNTLDEIKQAVDVFSKAGEACKRVGVQFAYHNHTTEFDDVEGHRPFDYILNNTDQNLVKMELDLAWATKAGQDIPGLFAQHPGRFPCWHVKDLDSKTKTPAEVGTGIVDFKMIFSHAKHAGMKYFFIEQDGAPDPLRNVSNSYNYLRKIL